VAAKPPKKTPKVRGRDNTNLIDEDGLTQVEIAALNEYIVNGGKQSDALRVANPKAKGWTVDAVNVEASQLFNRPRVRIRLAQMRAEQAKRTAVTSDRILIETSRLAFSDARRLFDENGNLLHPSEWPDDVAASVASMDFQIDRVTQDTDEEEFDGDGKQIAKRRMTVITRHETSTKKIKFWDKNSALEKLFKHMGLFEADNRQKNPLTADLANLPLPLLQLIQERLREAVLPPAAPSERTSAPGDGVKH